MEIIIIANLFAFLIISVIGLVIGLDIKKWYSWLYGVYGFLSGFLIGAFMVKNVSLGLQMGAIFAFAVMFAGATLFRAKQRYTKEYYESTKDAFDKRHREAQEKRKDKARKKR